MAKPVIGLIGKKCGMTRVFTESGESVPVTVVEVQPNVVVQVKTVESDGYSAIQITIGSKKASKLSKAEAGHFARAGVEAGLGLWEFKLEKDDESLKVGAEYTVELFEAGQKIDVKAKSKGKGFAGTIKRYNFRSQRASHGNSLAHRKPGSIGQCQTPGRVFKGKKMPGHMGNENVTVQNLEVFMVDKEKNLLLIKGAVPGAVGGYVTVISAVKDSTQAA